jgi:DNA-binding NarL/FixJ family response regulator
MRRCGPATRAPQRHDRGLAERKILLLLAEGKTNKEIAGDVFLSDKTVKN